MNTLDAGNLTKILTALSAVGGQAALGSRGIPHVAITFAAGRLVFESFDAVAGARAVLEDKGIEAAAGDTETRHYPLVELRELVRRFGGEIGFGQDANGHLLLASAGSKYTIKAIVPETPLTFPFAEGDSEERFQLTGQRLRDALAQVLVVAKSSAGRSYSSGTLFDFRGPELRLVNTDGFRMAVVSLDDVSGLVHKVQAETEALKNVAKAIVADEEPVEGEIRPDHLLLVQGAFRYYITTLTVTYPDYEKILDRPHPGQIAFDRKEMMAALERLDLIGKYQEQSNAVLLSFQDDEATIEVDETLRGVGKEPLALSQGAAEGFKVALNGHFLLDFLRTTACDTVHLLYDGPHTSCLFQAADDPSFRYFLMTLKHPKVSAP